MILKINEANSKNNKIDKEVIRVFTDYLKQFTTDEDNRVKELYVKGYITIHEMFSTMIKNHSSDIY